MKFIPVCILSLFLALSGSAQVAFGIQAGPQMMTARYAIKGKKQESDFKYGFMAGAFMKVPFDTRLYFAPAVYYSYKGYRVKLASPSYPPDPIAVDNDVNLHCVELAALLQYDFSDKPGHLFIKFGPSLDFQLFGKETYNKLTGGSVSRNMKFGYSDYGRYSANAIGQLGYETSAGWLIGAQYTYGLTSINNADNGPLIGHRLFGITIGKIINRNKIVIDTRNRE